MRKTTPQKPPTDVFVPNERHPLTNRKKPLDRRPQATVELVEVGTHELRVGDTIRACIYQALPGRWFASPKRHLDWETFDLELVRIEPSFVPSNGFYRAYEVLVAMSACGRVFTLDQSDYYVHERAAAQHVVAEARHSVAPAMRALPNPDSRARFDDVIDGEYEEPKE
jgi:hypothetical protein